MYSFKMNKLFRDKIVRNMETHEVKFDYEVLDDNQFINALKEKLLEESLEVMESKNDSELIEELSDVMEVINTLLETKKITMEQVLQNAENKKKEKGGFKGRYKIHSLALSKENNTHTTWIKYFLEHPNKYPMLSP